MKRATGSAASNDVGRPRVDQLLPAAHAGDATGDAALHLARALRERGYQARLWALTVDPEVRDRVESFEAFPAPRPGDVTLLHFALPSPLSDALLRCRGRRMIVYHNLTPPDMLARHAPSVARLTALGRQELGRLADSGEVDLAVGVSRYNTEDLRSTGFHHTATLPLPMDMRRYDVAPDPVLARQLRDSPPIFLTVGRVAPNKRLEDLLRVAAYYLRHVDPDARFAIVGGSKGLEGYARALRDLHGALGLDERVQLVGRVSHRELVAWYRAARVYLCMSAHEGFCAPLLEAMHFRVPILAREAAAVPETLAGAGILFDDADPAAVGEMLRLLAASDRLREALAEKGRRRLRAFRPAAVTDRWIDAIEGVGPEAP